MQYTIIPAPRANREGRLDAPWNVIDTHGTILRRGFDRDNAEEILERLAKKFGWRKSDRRDANIYESTPTQKVAYKELEHEWNHGYGAAIRALLNLRYDSGAWLWFHRTFEHVSELPGTAGEAVAAMLRTKLAEYENKRSK